MGHWIHKLLKLFNYSRCNSVFPAMWINSEELHVNEVKVCFAIKGQFPAVLTNWSPQMMTIIMQISSRNCTHFAMLMNPHEAVACKGVHPSLSPLLTSAPFATKNSTISRLSSMHACNTKRNHVKDFHPGISFAGTWGSTLKHAWGSTLKHEAPL